MWFETRLSDIAIFNPRETLKKGEVAKKIAMEQLQPFCRDVSSFDFAPFNGGMKFRNGDTIMARITPCLENGKLAKVNVLNEDEVGFGSTEYIVLRAREGTDEDFLYYLVYSSYVRSAAIKSMVGSSGRQRVQMDVLENLPILVPSYSDQQKIGRTLKRIDDKIALNQCINKNLEEQVQVNFSEMLSSSGAEHCCLSDIANINPKRPLLKGAIARYIDMAQLSTSSSCPNGWISKPFNGGTKFRNGDTLLARITPCLENGKKAFINFLQEDEIAFGSTEYIVISPKESYPAEFFYCLIKNAAFMEYAVKNMNGSSGRQRVSAEIIQQYKLPRISLFELDRFSGLAPKTFTTIRNNFLENIRLAELRDALLPRLMSGEIDVSNITL